MSDISKCPGEGLDQVCQDMFCGDSSKAFPQTPAAGISCQHWVLMVAFLCCIHSPSTQLIAWDQQGLCSILHRIWLKMGFRKFPKFVKGWVIGVQKSERWRQTDSTEINMMDHKIIPRFHVWKFQRNTPNIQAMGATGSVPTVAKGFSINFPLMSCFHGKCQGCYGYRHFPCILREVPGSKQNCGHILLRVATLVHAWCIIILHKAVESTSFQGFFSNKLADLL